MTSTRPAFEEITEFRQGKKEVLGIFSDGCCTGDGRFGIDQIHRRIGSTALLAVIAILIFGFTFRAGAFDVTVGEEQLLFRIVSLGNALAGDMAIGLQPAINHVRKFVVFSAVR